MRNPPSLALTVAALTHVGLRRHANEDCMAVNDRILYDSMTEPAYWRHPLDTACVCLVADGMGGHPAGDVASRMVVESIVSQLAGGKPSRERLIDVLREANRCLFVEMARCPERYGMGTTVAGIIADAQGLVAFNIGDSRIYRLYEVGVEQVSVDDSESAGFSWLLFGHPPVRVLNQCLGGFPDAADLVPHVFELPAAPGSAFLICSDGLSDMVSDEAIVECIDPDPRLTAENLLHAALHAGGIDNVSILVAQIEDDAAGEPG
jgi:serine/threonine protein phosphatase PrpC